MLEVRLIQCEGYTMFFVLFTRFHIAFLAPCKAAIYHDFFNKDHEKNQYQLTFRCGFSMSPLQIIRTGGLNTPKPAPQQLRLWRPILLSIGFLLSRSATRKFVAGHCSL